MPDSKYFGIPFATSGDKTAIPEATQPSGAVSYTQGFGPDYERPPATDPLAKRVPRSPTNQFYFDVTNSLKFLQLYGLPEWYATDSAGGAVSYPLGARVRVGTTAWLSVAATNTATPGTDGTKWVLLDSLPRGDVDIPIKGWQAAPPGSPAVGDRYVVAPSPTGLWAGQATKVATWFGSWVFTTPTKGLLANYVDVSNVFRPIFYDGTIWVPYGGESIVGRTQIITSTTTFVVPAGVTSLEVEGWGAGGAVGASGDGVGNPSGAAGAGGGAGGYGYKRLTGLTSGASITATIGAGGIAVNNASANGGNGGTTSFGAFMSLTGGQGGPSGRNATVLGGSGGSATGADLGVSGGRGGTGGPTATFAAEFLLHIWNKGGLPARPLATMNLFGTGNPGTGYGDGGSGASGGSALAGGNGAPGLLIVRW